VYNNIKINEDKIIFKLIYKICNHQPGDTCFDVILLINTVTNEVLGMGKIKQTDAPKKDLLCNLSGNWRFINAEPENGISISVEGKCINGSNQNSTSRKNAEINLSLEKDWRSGVASFKYLSEKEWLHSSYAQVELSADQNLSELTSIAQLRNNDATVLH